MSTAARHRIVLVEDDEIFLHLLRKGIRNWSNSSNVVEFQTGLDALSWIKRQDAAPHVVLVDIGLPDVSGIEVIGAARQRFPRTPILVISIMTSERSVLDAIRAGASGYLLKDGTEADIASAISQAMKGGCPLSPSLARYLFKAINLPAEEQKPSVSPLSERETETIRYISKGLTYEQTARVMGISLSTVQTHVRNLYRKLDVSTQAQAATKARDHGII